MELRISQQMTLLQKLEILTDAAKYDVACTSSGVERNGDGRGVGNTKLAGICHSFSSDGTPVLAVSAVKNTFIRKQNF